MLVSKRRKRLRHVLNGDETVILPAVFDAVSARIVELAGFEVALVSGSVSAASLQGVPDLILVTITEVAQLTRRIVESTDLSIHVDADHGFGNALNVMRCVRELEAAGASSLTLEDTDLPRPYGSQGPTAISIREMCGKLRAAVEARDDPSLVIIGRTDTLRYRGLEEALERALAYQETGVDAIFLPGARTRGELEAIREAISLPLIASGLPEPENGKSGLQILQEIGYSMTLLAAFPFRVAVQAMVEAAGYLKENGEPGPYAERMCSPELLENILRIEQYAGYRKRFMSENGE
jgi:carboxyvinyl-carboxyphosphonate phosphorylmutase